MNDRFWIGFAIVVVLAALISPGHPGHASAQSPQPAPKLAALHPPANGTINVAFVISRDTNVMDLAGPWEAFQSTMLTSKGAAWRGDENDMVMPFNVYTVSDSMEPLSANGLILIPSFTFESAPKPQVIVIPAQGGRTAAQKAWLLRSAKTADLTMSVCTGASMLAAYGLLDHQKATTHHMYMQDMQARYPSVQFVSGIRYVENERVSTAGGLTSGIDLALHVVERYYGRGVAQGTAEYMEYTGELWKHPQYAEIKEVPAKE